MGMDSEVNNRNLWIVQNDAGIGVTVRNTPSRLRFSDGVLIAVIRWLKKRCFADSNADLAADFACALSVPVAPVMFAARIAASRLL